MLLNLLNKEEKHRFIDLKAYYHLIIIISFFYLKLNIFLTSLV